MQRHAEILVHSGYQVLLVGRELPNSKPLVKRVFNQHRLMCYFNSGKLFYLEYNIRLFLFLLVNKFSIYLAVDLDTLLPNLLVSKARKGKLVFDSHEYFTEVPEVTNRPFVKFIWEIIAKIAIPKTDLAYTVGPELAKIFSKKYNQDFHFLLNVPDLKVNQKRVRNTEPLLFYQGALNEGRGLESLILSMKKVQAKLQIAGEGDLSFKLRELVRKEELIEKVDFLGFIMPKDLPTYTQNATIALNLLELKGQSYYYSLANKFFDYIHAEIPQICANFPEYQSINSTYEVAILVNCDVDEISLAINNLLSNKELYRKLQNNCMLASQVYNLQNESKKLITLFNTI